MNEQALQEIAQGVLRAIDPYKAARDFFGAMKPKPPTEPHVSSVEKPQGYLQDLFEFWWKAWSYGNLDDKNEAYRIFRDLASNPNASFNVLATLSQLFPERVLANPALALLRLEDGQQDLSGFSEMVRGELGLEPEKDKPLRGSSKLQKAYYHAPFPASLAKKRPY
jgi:hypothetical protein